MQTNEIKKEFEERFCYIGTLGPDVWNKEFVMLPEYKQVESIRKFLLAKLQEQKQQMIEKGGGLKDPDMRFEHPYFKKFTPFGAYCEGITDYQNLIK